MSVFWNESAVGQQFDSEHSILLNGLFYLREKIFRDQIGEMEAYRLGRVHFAS